MRVTCTVLERVARGLPRFPASNRRIAGSRCAVVTALGTFALTSSFAPFGPVVAAEPDGRSPPAMASLPEAEPGACFARVSLPALHDVEPVEIERRSATVRFAPVPATFAPEKRRVVVRDASSIVRAVQPVLASETRRRELAPATTRWVRDAIDGELPLGPGDRLDLSNAGIELDTVEAGTCLVEHYRPARVTSTPERVLVREASEQLAVTDAVFETVEVSFVTRPEHVRLVEVPTVWKEGTQRVVVESRRVGGTSERNSAPDSVDAGAEIARPADEPVRFETRSRVTVEHPATLTRVREPASRENVEVQRLVTDAFGTREPLPADWDTIDLPKIEAPAAFVWQVEPTISSGTAVPEAPSTGAAPADDGTVPTGRRFCHREWPAEVIEYERVVVEEEGRFEREIVPAEHVVRDVEALLEKARGMRIDVPAVPETIERRVMTRDPSIEWRPVLCGTQVNGPLVSRLQRALARQGFSPGAIDGKLGPGTLEAVTGYQRANRLATGGLTLETVEALGVSR